MNKITFDENKCIGCKICYKACFIDVIRWDSLNKRPFAAYPEDCVNCCYCIAECPKGAVSIDVDYDYIRQWEAIPGDGRRNPQYQTGPAFLNKNEEKQEAVKSA